MNALYLIPGGVGGTEIYMRSLLAAMAEIDRENEFFVFANRETGPDLAPSTANFHFVACAVRARSRPLRILYEQLSLPLCVREYRCDVLLNGGFTAPLMAPCQMVTVFHDLQHKRHPEHFRWFDLPFWRLLLWGAAHRSALLLACSEATRADLLRYYGKRARLALYGVDPAFFSLSPNPDRERPYLLAVSTLHPHKNLGLLLRAFARFRGEQSGFRLVVAGIKGFHSAQLEALSRSLGIEQAVTFTGWVPREDLYRLYERAWGFLYPSTFEGFGLPVLEAMAAGIPVVCSDIEPLASNAGGAALLFDPQSEDGLLDALRRVSLDGALRERLAAEGPARARQFDWRSTARLTIAALREAVDSKRGRTPTAPLPPADGL